MLGVSALVRRGQIAQRSLGGRPIALREPSSAAAPGDAPLPITAPTTRCAHDGWVQAAALTRDAGLAATGDSNGEVRIWAPRSHTPARAAYAHGSWVLAIAFAPRGDVVVSAGADGGIVRYDLATGERAWLGTHEGSVRAIAFAPDGRSFATGGSDGTVRITSVGGAPLAVCDHGEPVRAVGFSPCGTKLATAGAAGVTRLWDPATGAPVGKFEPPAASVQALAFSRDGTLCTTARSPHCMSMAMWVVRMTSQSRKTMSANSGAEVSAPISSARPQSHQITLPWTRMLRTGRSWKPPSQRRPLSTMAS